MVARVRDSSRQKDYAIKIMRKNPVMEASGEHEYSLVQTMRKSSHVLGA